MIVEAALSVILEAALKKAFDLGRDALRTASDAQRRRAEAAINDVSTNSPVTALEINFISDTQQADGELRIELAIQGPSSIQAQTLPFGDTALMEVTPGDQLITALLLYVGPGVKPTSPMLAAGGQRQVTVPKGTRQTVTVHMTTPSQHDAQKLGFPADHVFYQGRRVPPAPPQTVRDLFASLGRGIDVRPPSPAEAEARFRRSARYDLDQRTRAEQAKNEQQAPSCGARTRVGGPCLDVIEEHGLCHNHLSKARSGGRVLWHATGQPVVGLADDS